MRSFSKFRPKHKVGRAFGLFRGKNESPKTAQFLEFVKEGEKSRSPSQKGLCTSLPYLEKHWSQQLAGRPPEVLFEPLPPLSIKELIKAQRGWGGQVVFLFLGQSGGSALKLNFFVVETSLLLKLKIQPRFYFFDVERTSCTTATFFRPPRSRSSSHFSATPNQGRRLGAGWRGKI